jgi:RNA polymerase sigma-70 factor (ECF subfamily)
MRQGAGRPDEVGHDPGRGAPDPSDEDLLRRISDGDEEAFRFLFRRWAPRLGRFLSGATGSRETAEDLLQETFLRILRGAPKFEPRGSAGAWMYRIAANLAYSHWRRERSRPLYGAEGAETIATLTAPMSTIPDNERLRRAFLSDTETALDRLDANKRVVFLLKVKQGLTYEEVAAVLRCPVGTAKSRFHHAVRRLQRDLEKNDWGECAEMEDGDIDVE